MMKDSQDWQKFSFWRFRTSYDGWTPFDWCESQLRKMGDINNGVSVAETVVATEFILMKKALEKLSSYPLHYLQIADADGKTVAMTQAEYAQSVLNEMKKLEAEPFDKKWK